MRTHDPIGPKDDDLLVRMRALRPSSVADEAIGEIKRLRKEVARLHGAGGKQFEICIYCGKPTMHMGNVCFSCNQPESVAARESGHD